MINKDKIYSSKRQNFLIALCFIVYCSSYLGKYTFNASINSVINFYGVLEDDAGLIGSTFFFAYGAGQIINGILCRFYNKKYMLGFSLVLSTLINIAIYLGIPFNYIKYIWFVNGFSLSCLWSSIVLILSESLAPKYFAKAVVILSFCTPLGTILAYAMSALFVAVSSFKDAFLCGGIIMLICGLGWILAFDKATLDKNEQAYYLNESTAQSSEETDQTKPVVQTKIKRKVASSVIVLVCILGLFSVINYFMRDGLSTWVPKILKEGYELPESVSIILTLVVPLLGALGAYLAVPASRKIKNPINLSAIFFLGEVVTVGLIALSFRVNMWLVLALLGLVNLFAQAICNLFTSILPLTMRDKVNSGLLSGLLNGCGYIGATISTYGLGYLQTLNIGWVSIFIILTACAIIPVVTSVGIIIAQKIKRKKEERII
ncbi:MAG: MFS transporter [Clostridia bacterium]|nr:MFS transporter [Clostridia bacterium]